MIADLEEEVKPTSSTSQDVSQNKPQFKIPQKEANVPTTNGKAEVQDKAKVNQKQAKPPKEKKPAAPKEPEHPLAIFNKAHMQVCRIASIARHPEAEKLFVCQLDLGNGASRQVCGGYVGHYTAEELLNRNVVVLLNLKPRKLKGVESAGMILAGDTGAVVKALAVPDNASVGDRIVIPGLPPQNPDKQLSGTVWEELAKDLKIIEGQAFFRDQAMATQNGPVTCPVPDCDIH
eukprot:TRINITY_DN1641_c0_g1_i2.p1 TRINITY_DN1641_c0_g1~~TRINITY_DN1641_c0_g1_i2.p1  ORF type:complete len:263 (-),score=70.65 TRINITY_DN1641_c0_g1_i2:89-787(-)